MWICIAKFGQMLQQCVPKVLFFIFSPSKKAMGTYNPVATKVSNNTGIA